MGDIRPLLFVDIYRCPIYRVDWRTAPFKGGVICDNGCSCWRYTESVSMVGLHVFFDSVQYLQTGVLNVWVPDWGQHEHAGCASHVVVFGAGFCISLGDHQNSAGIRRAGMYRSLLAG